MALLSLSGGRIVIIIRVRTGFRVVGGAVSRGARLEVRDGSVVAAGLGVALVEGVPEPGWCDKRFRFL